jgi:hypothetical protein
MELVALRQQLRHLLHLGLFTVAGVTVVTPGSVPRLPNPAQPESASVKLTSNPAIPRRRCVVAVMVAVMTGLLSVGDLLKIAECLRKASVSLLLEPLCGPVSEA